MEFSGSELRRAAAIHEAGHAIVAWTVGLIVRQLRIEEGGRGTSCIECRAELPVLDQIAVAAAGMEAVELLNAVPWELAAMADAAKINDILNDYPSGGEHVKARGHSRAREILIAQMTLLADLADALALSGYLDEDGLRPYKTL